MLTVSIRIVPDSLTLSYQVRQKLWRDKTIKITTEPAIIFIHCYWHLFLY